MLFCLDFLGILLSFLYGKYGGSGGETTEGVFIGIKVTGVIVLTMLVATFLIYRDAMRKYIFYALPLALISILQVVFLDLIK